MTALSNSIIMQQHNKTQLTSVSHFIKQNDADAERSPCFISTTSASFAAASTHVSCLTVPTFSYKISN
jgi:hypothetical protein